ncbi:MAG: L-seryl-tRNA(Sec) selenium transferase, partial [Planctomycetes bacterium]|nr:L-seryl-tRNA(Sec) selenium transferase [Planctomycetota bacterium]
VAEHSLSVVTRHLRSDLDGLRERGLRGELEETELALDAVRRRLRHALELAARPYYRRVINGTGVILHTGLGRAPLPERAVRTLNERSGAPLRVELDLESGERGGRDLGCAELLCELTGAERATVVNNNAAATMLILGALARGKRVVISRGELVEIGGSYRIPDVMEESGARLVEVGTTNRTHLRDYRQAIDEETGLILKVHTSNYRIEGFTKEVSIDELVALGREHAIPVVHDLGSGCLIDLERHGIPGEPHVSTSLRAGADLVCFSGDKLLGGPQSGLILGRKDAVERCRKHPLYRAVRPCRLTYMALESVLRIYREGTDAAIREVPALRRLLTDGSELRTRAERLAARLSSIDGLGEVQASPDRSMAGSGSLPARYLPTWGVEVRPPTALADWGRALRTGDPAVLPRVRDDALFFDVRTLDDDEFDELARRLSEVAVTCRDGLSGGNDESCSRRNSD